MAYVVNDQNATIFIGDYVNTQIMSNLGWQSLEVRRVVSRLTLIFKIVHGFVDFGSQILVKSGRATRQSTGQHQYRNIQAHKNCYRSSFFPRTIPEWNHISSHIQNATSVGRFKSSLTRDLHINDSISKAATMTK